MNFFTVNEDKQVPALLTTIGGEMYALLHNLPAPVYKDFHTIEGSSSTAF